ncbi:MAG: DUF6326 family protein [Hyphomicrobiales bacterium]
MISGTIDGVKVTEFLMLFGGILIEIPILMTVLAVLLPYVINRWANIGVGLFTIAMVGIAGRWCNNEPTYTTTS